jgi:hypothetical protein
MTWFRRQLALTWIDLAPEDGAEAVGRIVAGV